MTEKHISSLVIYVKPEGLHQLIQTLEAIEHLDVSAMDAEQGKIIVVLETDTTDSINSTIDTLGELPHVVSVVMVYHHFESDHSLNEALE